MNRGITLKDAFKTETFELGKIMAPEQTVGVFREKLAGVRLDILKETVRIDNGRLDIPVYFSLCGRDAETATGAKKQMGKGASPSQAEASAVMELAERYSLFTFSSDPANFIRFPHEEVSGKAMGLDQIRLSVHDDSIDASAALDLFSMTPVKWTAGVDLTTGDERLVPFDWFFALNEYNGSAAGNCIEEAVLQALCEVVERHVSSVVSRSKMTVPIIDKATVTDPVARGLLDKFEHAGISVFLFDMSLNTGIATVGVIAYDPATFPGRSEIVWTAGTSPDPQKAVVRALTEAAQLGGDFNSGSSYVASGLPKPRALEDVEFLTGGETVVSIRSLPDLSDSNIRVEVEQCVQKLADQGLHAFVIDVTNPDLKIPAVYVVVPGAHFRERTSGTSVGMLTAKLIAGGDGADSAIPLLQEMNRRLPGKYYTRFFLGLTYLSIDEPGEALQHLRAASDLDPAEQELPTIYSYTGVCLKELERYREALEVLKKAEQLDRERTDVYNLMGFCHFKLKEHEKAIECFKSVLALNPGSGIDYANIASNYRDMGKVEEAVQYYSLALELDPDLDFARENLVRLQGAENNG
ncbi:MAG TPA: tetratricopeptide repeat protein [Desulfobacteraceae bacterium]|nr:tetratricopeptide repeat protein [Desulfobacteraceae bacterium]